MHYPYIMCMVLSMGSTALLQQVALWNAYPSFLPLLCGPHSWYLCGGYIVYLCGCPWGALQLHNMHIKYKANSHVRTIHVQSIHAHSTHSHTPTMYPTPCIITSQRPDPQVTVFQGVPTMYAYLLEHYASHMDDQQRAHAECVGSEWRTCVEVYTI